MSAISKAMNGAPISANSTAVAPSRSATNARQRRRLVIGTACTTVMLLSLLSQAGVGRDLKEQRLKGARDVASSLNLGVQSRRGARSEICLNLAGRAVIGVDPRIVPGIGAMERRVVILSVEHRDSDIPV